MRVLLLLTLIALMNLSLVTGCGQKGDLVLPERGNQTAIDEDEEKQEEET